MQDCLISRNRSPSVVKLTKFGRVLGHMGDLFTQLPSIIRGELLKYLGKSEPTLDKVTIFKDRSKFCNAFFGKSAALSCF